MGAFATVRHLLQPHVARATQRWDGHVPKHLSFTTTRPGAETSCNIQSSILNHLESKYQGPLLHHPGRQLRSCATG